MSILISGPISISIVTYNNIKFILFGDKHFFREGSCPTIMCNEIPCYDIDEAINVIIQRAMTHNKYVDIFLEAHFPHKISEGDFDITLDDFMGQTIRRYLPCLYNKQVCPYRNARGEILARFHYVNIRAGNEQKLSYDVLSKLRQFVNHYFVDIETLVSNDDRWYYHLEFFIYAFIVARFLNTNRYVDSNLWVYYNLCMNSDNFINDVKDFLDKLIVFDEHYVEDTINLLIYKYHGNTEYTPDIIRVKVHKFITGMTKRIYSWLTSPYIITNKYGRTMHKLRAQLVALELQDDVERATSIRNFIHQQSITIDFSQFVKLFNDINNARVHYMIYKDDTPMKNIFPLLMYRILRPLYLVDSLLVDAYTLARMFRKYPIELRTNNKSTTSHIMPSYILEYAGDEHIRVIKEYFALQGANIQTYTAQENERCIQVPGNFFE